MTAGVVGGVDFSFDKYRIHRRSRVRGGGRSVAERASRAFARDGAYSVANFNVENLYDYRDDPFDGCDFRATRAARACRRRSTTCPRARPSTRSTSMPRLPGLSDLHAPDVLLVQEVEDQDICTVAGATLACGSTNGADGKPDTLQELALRVAAMGGPAYDAAYDRNGADDRGIVAAFLYRSDRVELLPAAR